MRGQAIQAIATCNQCREISSITIGQEDLVAWKSGTFIQEAMPYLTAGERELLVSGICGKCFDDLFGGWEGWEGTRP